MRYSKICVTVLLCILLTAFPSCNQNHTSPNEQTIDYIISDEPVTLDPQIANDASSRLIIMNIFEGLTKLDENNLPVSGMSDKWETNLGDMEYVFHIRENARWSDGSPLTAQDFLYGFQRAFMPQTGSDTAKLLFCIKNAENIKKGLSDISSLGVTVQDEHTLVIQLEYQNPQFLSSLAEPPAMPCQKAFFESTGGQYGLEYDKILSNGAFSVSPYGWEHEKYIRLTRNDNYIGKTVPQGVNIRIADPPENVCSAILDGETDCSAMNISELSQARDNHLSLTAFGDTVWGLAFNTQHEVFASKDIRLALLQALDRDDIVSTLPDGCRAAEDIIPETAKIGTLAYRSFVGSGLGTAFSDNAKENFQKALDSLNSALENDEWWWYYDEPPKIEFPNLDILCIDEPSVQPVVNRIIRAWNSLTGEYANKTPVSREELYDKILSGEYDIVIAPLTPDNESPVSILKLFSTDSQYHPSALSDEVYDGLIANIIARPDNESIDKMIQAEKYLNDNGIFYPLYTENRYYVSAKNVAGIIFHPYGAEADFSLARKSSK